MAVYFSLYKFLVYKRRLEDAERVVRMALAEAAAQGGFDADWRRLTREGADWSGNCTAVHFYLFSLKALAFIRLRRGDLAECLALLAKLADIDPADQVGATVIADLARAV